MAWSVPLPSARTRWAAAAAVAAVVVGASLVPLPAGGGSVPAGTDSVPAGSTVLAHVLGYAAVAAATAVALDGERRPAVVLGGAVVAAVGLGGVVEILQGVVPGRSPSALDAAANALGAVVAVVLYRAGHRVLQFEGE